MIELELPWAPSVNYYKKPGRLSLTKTGKIYQTRVNTAETTQYFCDVWNIVQGLYRKGIKSFGDAKISLEVDAYPPDARKRDLDNICKVLIDSLMHAKLFDDDSQIDRLWVQRCPIVPPGKVVVRIREILYP